MKKTILLIDDDLKLIQALTQYFAQFEIEVLSSADPKEGLKLLQQKSPSLVILDVMLPGMTGFEVCKTIRAHSAIPIIMLTARGEVTDRIVGLELGADDYLSKPFEPRELLARVQSVLRRAHEPFKKRNLRFEDLEIDLNTRAVLLKGEPIELSTMEFEALALFANHPGKVMTRDEIMENLRGIEWEAYNRSIDVLISRLRQKLKDDPKKPIFFKTIWGTGYLFMAGQPEVES